MRRTRTDWLIMSEQEPENTSGLRRLVDGVEDAVENVARGVTRAADQVEDAVEQAITGRSEHHHAHHHRPDDDREDVHVTVNVNLTCCPPDCRDGTGGGGGAAGGGKPGRPGHVTGTTDGSLGPVTDPGGIISVVTRPPTVWPAPRPKLYLPYLFVRAFAGDTGSRPVNGVFWESPDILVMPGVDPAHAPALPPDLGGVAQAGADNTLYAHIWNLGQAPATDVLVEFYWFNPSLGFNAAAANLIGASWTDLAARGNTGSHRLVKCPVSWPAMYVNGGHECLMVRLSQPVTDPLSGPAWDAARNRHIGQRNIHVMSAAEAAAKPTIGLDVGPLFGGAAQLQVARANTATMPWLHLVTNDRNVIPATAAATGDVGITPARPVGTGIPDLGAVPDPRAAGLIDNTQTATADGQQVAIHATDADPGPGNAHVYRVSGHQDGSIFGGYTVVVLGQP
jgi:hypothetical protein